MGPGSRVTLNKFVYSGASRYEKATFQLVKGEFRFTTGASDKRAYEIQTPTATIGVRGTVLDIRVDAKVPGTLVVLQEGAASVCMVPIGCDRNRPDYDQCERDRRDRGPACGRLQAAYRGWSNSDRLLEVCLEH